MDQFLVHLVEAKPFFGAATAGAIAKLGLGMTTEETVAFASTVALGLSMGDALLTAAGVSSKIETYLDGIIGNTTMYVDPNDFIGAAIGVGLVNYAVGVQGNSLMMLVGVGALAGGVAPKLSSFLLSKLQPPTAPILMGGGGSSNIEYAPGPLFGKQIVK